MSMQEHTQADSHAAHELQSPKLRRESRDGETKPNLKAPRGAAGAGPGRKSRACESPSLGSRREKGLTDSIAGLECKKLKMKCEVFPGDRKCKHCLRRKAECVFKTTQVIQVDPDEDRYEYVSLLLSQGTKR